MKVFIGDRRRPQVWAVLGAQLLLGVCFLSGCDFGKSAEKQGLLRPGDGESGQRARSYLTPLPRFNIENIRAVMEGRTEVEGLPVFRVDADGVLTHLPDCIYPARFAYSAQDKVNTTFISGDDDAQLDLNAFLGRTSRRFPRNVERATKVVMVGALKSDLDEVKSSELRGPSGSCQGATHVASEIMLGASEPVSAELQGLPQSKARASLDVPRFGMVDNCFGPNDEQAPHLCDRPVRASLLPLIRDSILDYHMDTEVLGMRTSDATLTQKMMRSFDDKLQQELVRRGAREQVSINKLAVPSSNSVNCGVGASTKKRGLYVSCKRGKSFVIGEEVTPKSLASLTPRLSAKILEMADPSSQLGVPAPARRVVMLVDNSLSMLINDETTFTTADPHRSKRYELAMLLLRGMQDNGILPEVAVATFSGLECVSPVEIEGQQVWPLNDENRDRALAGLSANIEVAPSCKYNLSTDLVGPFEFARNLLSVPTERQGEDVVIMITDGAQQSPVADLTPQQAAVNLRAAGAELVVVRVQLNDLSTLREQLKSKNRKRIVARWQTFVNDEFEVDEEEWTDWLSEFPAQNDDGDALLTDLREVDISRFLLSTDDIGSEPLFTTHEQLLPQLGGIEPVFSARTRLVDEQRGAGNQRLGHAEYFPRVIRGRPFVLRVKIPQCMGVVSRGIVEATGTGTIPLKIRWQDGAIVSFEPVVIADTSASGQKGRLLNNEVKVIVQGELVDGGLGCRN